MLDAAIIGTGPAGLSAALNLKLHGKEFVWFGGKELSGKVERSEKIANYPGFGMIAGGELNARFQEQIEEMGLETVDKRVTTILPGGGGYSLLADNQVYQARCLLLAVGAVAAQGIPGEQELLGRGVSYCATCDGFLYRGKTIAVLCASQRYEHEVEYLAQLAERVLLFPSYPGCQIDLPNTEKLPRPIKQVLGEQRVSGIVLGDGSELAVDGLFCLRDAVAPATLLPGLAMDGPHIVVDREMKTNLPGCFAAGDCTGRPYQIAKAVGEGNVAAHSMLEYLSAPDRESAPGTEEVKPPAE